MFPISDSVHTHKFPFWTIAIILITIYVFIQEFIAPDPDSFISHYALIPSHITLSLLSFTPFVTAIFIHGGILHILTNMWFLWIFGDDVEAVLGRIFYPLLYLGAGITGNLTQYIFIPHASVPMIGASGAVAGVLGEFFVLFPWAKIKTFVL